MDNQTKVHAANLNVILNDNTGMYITRYRGETEDKDNADTYDKTEAEELLRMHDHYIAFKVPTPLMDAWEARLTIFDQTKRFEGAEGLETGDYAYIKTPTCQYFGIIKSIGRVNVILETPYKPSPGDYHSIHDLTFKKSLVHLYIKPKVA